MSWSEKPDILGSALTASPKGSLRRLNIEGDRGHPSHVALVMGKDQDKIFDMYTCAHGEE